MYLQLHILFRFGFIIGSGNLLSFTGMYCTSVLPYFIFFHQPSVNSSCLHISPHLNSPLFSRYSSWTTPTNDQLLQFFLVSYLLPLFLPKPSQSRFLHPNPKTVLYFSLSLFFIPVSIPSIFTLHDPYKFKFAACTVPYSVAA